MVAARRFVALSLLVVLAACRSAGSPPPVPGAAPPAPSGRAGLDAALWAQTAAEARAISLAVFAGARRELEAALADPSRTALGQGPEAAALPPAVIADVDETLLDNGRFQGRLIDDGIRFDATLWTEWVKRAEADAMPGAVEFARFAAARGVTLFYVTNRDAHHEAPTRANLERAGFPLAVERDTVLTRGERPEWRSDKTGRRDEVARSYRVLLLLGDDLNDFVAGASVGVEARRGLVDAVAERWGRDWFMLPNAMYGSWEGAILGRGELAADEILRRKLDAVRGFP
jgi:acid phosphatase